jgi:hypothetical protein
VRRGFQYDVNYIKENWEDRNEDGCVGRHTDDDDDDDGDGGDDDVLVDKDFRLRKFEEIAVATNVI